MLRNKMLFSGVLACSVLLAACGGEVPEPGEQDVSNAPPTEEMSTVEQAAEAYIVASDTTGFPSWLFGGTSIKVYGAGSEAVDVHMWCTNDVDDVWFNLRPGEYRNFWWKCGGHTIVVHNNGTPGNSNQLIRVQTW